MALRYLRRPLKSAEHNAAHGDAARKPKGKRSRHKPGEFVPVYDNACLPRPVVDVKPDECEQLARALAYFCVACGREHTSGEVRCSDVTQAETLVIEAIKRAQ
jgi:hypothetical protein